MAAGGAGLRGRAVADGRAADDQGWFVGAPRFLDCGGDGLVVMPVDGPCVPTAGFEPDGGIVGIGKRGRPVDRNVVAVVERDELGKAQIPGERDRLLADALHQAAIAHKDIRMVIDQRIAVARRQHALGQRHADSIGDALAERPGGGFDTGRVAIFRMPRRLAAELAEALDLLDVDIRIAGQIKQRIKQHRAVAVRDHETVAIGPGGIGGVEFQESREQHRGQIGHTHGHAGVARVRLLHRVDRQHTDGVGHLRGRCGRVPGLVWFVGHAWTRDGANGARNMTGEATGVNSIARPETRGRSACQPVDALKSLG